jgi:membrane-bound lytic murein transglycosylase B
VIFVVLLAVGALLAQYLLTREPSRPAAAADAAPSSPAPTHTVAPVTTPSLPALPKPPSRPADQLADWAGRVAPVVDIPVVALEAYGYAELLTKRDDPGCHLGWTTLAGVGEVESHHGQLNGAVLLPNGRSRPEILGPPLDGKNGNALVPDTDAGAYDGDPTYDRAMGPMQLLPSVWAIYAADADGDGILDVYDIDDASLALARMLCAGNEDLNQLSGWNAAIGRLHPGETYAKAVFTAADHYGQLSKSIG